MLHNERIELYDKLKTLKRIYDENSKDKIEIISMITSDDCITVQYEKNDEKMSNIYLYKGIPTEVMANKILIEIFSDPKTDEQKNKENLYESKRVKAMQLMKT